MFHAVDMLCQKTSPNCGDSTLVLFFLCSSQVASLPVSQVEEDDISSVYGKEVVSAAEDDKEGTVYFVLEESSGYMELALHFLAVAHTVISFCCIIGYYCLKVHWHVGLSTYSFRLIMNFCTDIEYISKPYQLNSRL